MRRTQGDDETVKDGSAKYSREVYRLTPYRRRFFRCISDHLATRIFSSFTYIAIVLLWSFVRIFARLGSSPMIAKAGHSVTVVRGRTFI